MWIRFKNKYIGDADFYRKVLLLVVPMIVQNLVTSFVSLLDNIMVGRIGTEQMSGVAIVNQLLFVFYIAIFGAVSGAGIFGTQFYGKGDYKGQRYAFRFKIYVSILFAIVAILLFTFFSPELISLYLSDEGSVGDVGLALEYGKEYLAIMVIGLIPFAFGQAYINTVRETGETMVPMLASMAAVFSNLILDYLLIFGSFGAPKMGVKGAAAATVVARFIECLIVLIWTHTHVEKNPYVVGIYKSGRIPSKILFDILKKGSPLMINEFMWAAGMATISQCYAVRGLEVVAAQNISSTIGNLFNTVFIQMGASIAVIVGQHLGAGRVEEAKRDDTRMIFFSVASCTVVAIIMMMVGRLFPDIYKTQESIKELAKSFIMISALVMPICSFSHCSYFTLRSGGKTIITFLFDSVYTWIFVIPIATLLAKYTSLPIVTVFFLVQFLEIFKATIGYFMVKSGIWIQNIT